MFAKCRLYSQTGFIFLSTIADIAQVSATRVECPIRWEALLTTSSVQMYSIQLGVSMNECRNVEFISSQQPIGGIAQTLYEKLP